MYDSSETSPELDDFGLPEVFDSAGGDPGHDGADEWEDITGDMPTLVAGDGYGEGVDYADTAALIEPSRTVVDGSGRPPAEQLANTAKQASWQVFQTVPSRLGPIAVRVPPEAAAEEVQKLVDWQVGQLPPEIPLPERLEQKLPAMRQFVAETAGVAVEDLPSLGAAIDTQRHGLHMPEFRHAYISPMDREGLPQGHIDMVDTSEEITAVHELAHGAYDKEPVHKIVVIKPQAGQASRQIDFTQSAGLGKIYCHRVGGQVEFDHRGSFFRESWPEEVAARYAAAQGLRPQPTDTTTYSYALDGGGQVDIDPKYVTRRGEYWGIAQPALAAQAMDRLDACRAASMPDSRPFFEIMKDLRRAETRVAGQREFIATMNSLQPGLYRTLRGLDYTDQDFAAGLRIANELHRQLVS